MTGKALYLITIIILIFSFSCKKKENVMIHRKGMVNFFSGSVYIISNNNKAKAAVGAEVKQGMKIVTKENSFVDIYFGENVVKILAKSSVEIKKLVFDLEKNSEQTEFFIFNGKIFSKIKQKLMKNDSYKVKSPSTVAGVRGTEFLVTEENGKGTVSCMEGKVGVQSSGAPEEKLVEINGGQEVLVEEGKKLSVRALSEKNKSELNSILKNIRASREDIRKEFKDERDRIRNEIKEHKEAVRKMVRDQKEETKKEIEKIKEDVRGSREEFKDSKEDIDRIKGSVDEFKEDAKKDKEQMREEAKKRKEKMREEAKKLKEDLKVDMDSLKPDLNKMEDK